LTKKELLNYRSMQQRIRVLICEIHKFKTFATVKSSDHNVKVYGYGIDRKAELQKLWDEKRALALKCNETFKFIDGIEDYHIRKIFFYRYIQGDRRPTWVQLSFFIGGGNTDEGIRKAHDRYLKF